MTEKPKFPKTFATPAYVKEIERGTYGLFRNIDMEYTDPNTGKKVREKVQEVGPMRLLREAQKGEETLVVLRTYDPVTQRPIALVEVEGQ